MLSEKSRPYIDASVPVLREHGLQITTLFYKTMFEAHPELTNLFNMGNQANGSQQQSLASAVFAYAANYRNHDALAPVITRIAHKHAAVGLTSAHYPIVGRHLLGAISTTLGEAATPELLAAWDEAYWLLAGELIAAESRLYERAGIAPQFRNRMKVVQRTEQAQDMMSLTLVPESGSPPAEFRPGQYISVHVELEPGVTQQRQYSLSDAPNGRDWRITVRRDKGLAGTPQGAVSSWLHDHAAVGMTLLTSQPFGDFMPALDGDEPIVLMSAGVGITPMISVLNALAGQAAQRKVVFVHAARNRSCLAHLSDLEQARQKMPGLTSCLHLEDGEAAAQEGVKVRHGRMDAGELLEADPELAKASFYLCGPLPFMQAQRASLVARDVPVTQIHREVFGPDLLDHLL